MACFYVVLLTVVAWDSYPNRIAEHVCMTSYSQTVCIYFVCSWIKPNHAFVHSQWGMPHCIRPCVAATKFFGIYFDRRQRLEETSSLIQALQEDIEASDTTDQTNHKR